MLCYPAGHCSWSGGSQVVNNPFYNNGTEVGPMVIAIIGGFSPSTASLDTGLIATSSSDIIWTGDETRTTIFGNATPPGGGRVCSEGVVGLERCGNIVGTNLGPLRFTGSEFPGGAQYLNNVDEFNTGNGILLGDSGGPEYEKSIFGPLITGVNIGTGSPYGFGEDIQALLYVYSAYYDSAVVVNTPSNP